MEGFSGSDDIPPSFSFSFEGTALSSPRAWEVYIQSSGEGTLAGETESADTEMSLLWSVFGKAVREEDTYRVRGEGRPQCPSQERRENQSS